MKMCCLGGKNSVVKGLSAAVFFQKFCHFRSYGAEKSYNENGKITVYCKVSTSVAEIEDLLKFNHIFTVTHQDK